MHKVDVKVVNTWLGPQIMHKTGNLKAFMLPNSSKGPTINCEN